MVDRSPYTSLSRAALSRRSAFAGLAGVAATGLLAACGSPGRNASASGSASPTPKAAVDKSATEKVVNWSNWPEYIDVDSKGNHPSIDAFTKSSGIKVKYNEDYNDNDEFFAKVRPLLEAGQDTGRDTWVSTDWMVARLIRLGYVQPLDYANIPNLTNLEPSLKDAPFDPGTGVLAALADRLRRHRLQPEGDRRSQGHQRRPAACTTPHSRARSACSPRCATPSDLC